MYSAYTWTRHIWFLLLTACVFFIPVLVSAATLSLTPSTGVYSTGQTFSARVVVNTEGATINAAEGTLSFNPSELSVVAVTKGTLFNLWTAEPSFSNAAGTVSFSGGTPTGYKGAGGTVLTITFRANGSGPVRVRFSDGSVLAADGRGTNVLSGMNGGSYTIAAQSTAPVPEVVEYVPPANTPAAPQLTSVSHPDQGAWYSRDVAELSWDVPSGITGVRTLLDQSPSTVPTRVYETPIDSLTIEDLDNGVNYLHIQFRNSDGWGKVAHYRLAVDTEAPRDLVLELPAEADLSKPKQTLLASSTETVSGIVRYLIQIDGGEPVEFIDEDAAGVIELPALEPGYHTVVVEAFDAAGNSAVATRSLTIAAFTAPVFTEVPEEVSTNVIPVIRGSARPNSEVTTTITRINGGADDAATYTTRADGEGVFTVIPDGRLLAGVYELTATAVAEDGSQSETSAPVRMLVQEPGYLRLGSVAVSVLSVVVPLTALVLVLVGVVWFGWIRLRSMRRGVSHESSEAVAILGREFSELHTLLEAQRRLLSESRKTKKLTKAESTLLDELTHALSEAEGRVRKEIEDVSDMVD